LLTSVTVPSKAFVVIMFGVSGRSGHSTSCMLASSIRMDEVPLDFDAAKNDDSFYLPPEAFDNDDFKRGIKLFMSPDGHAVRFTIIHQGDPLTQEGTSRIEPLKIAAEDAIKGTPLEGSMIYLGGSAAMYKDMQQGANYDLLIAAVAALILIFIIRSCHESGPH